MEITPLEAHKSSQKMIEILGSNGAASVHRADFFKWIEDNSNYRVDCVVGNPPFIRYQNFPEPSRSTAIQLLKKLDFRPNKLTNIWVPFVALATAHLVPGGRLAMVLPAELLQVSYAAQLRAFLADHFENINMIACNELFFEKAEQEVVLLLADGALATASKSNLCRVTLTEARRVTEITERQPVAVLSEAQPKSIRHDNEKWLKYFLTEREIVFMRELRLSAAVTSLSSHASVDVGVVTGKNEFFVLNGHQVAELGLDGYTIPLVSRSVQLKGARLRKTDWNALAAAGNRVHLLHLAPLNGAKLAKSLASYIRLGEINAIHKGYKCSNRIPWYAVPSVWTPDGFVFRQIYDFPRMVLNRAGATSTDTIHRLTCKVSPEMVISNTYTYMTAASAEIEGRSYGGGVLELEPTEAERLLMPATLTNALPLEECDRLTRAGRLEDVLTENARIILMGAMGLSRSDSALLRGIWVKMRDRRLARRRNGRPSIDAEPSQ